MINTDVYYYEEQIEANTYYIWYSKAFPDKLTDKLLGYHCGSIRALQQYFYIITISLNATKFRVNIRHPTGDSLETKFYEMCKSRLDSLSKCMSTLFPMKHAEIVLNVLELSQLCWVDLPECRSLIDTHGRKYALLGRKTSRRQLVGLMDALKLNDSNEGESNMSLAINSNDHSLIDLDTATTNLIDTYCEIVHFFQTKRSQDPIPTFQFWVELGIQAYKSHSLDRLPSPFTFKSARNASRHRRIRPSFLTRFASYTKQALEQAMATQFKMASLQCNTEQISVRFELKASHWYPGALRIGVDIPGVYVPRFEFMANLVYDSQTDLFVLQQEKELQLSDVTVNSIRMIELVNDPRKIPVSARMVQSITQPKNGPSSGDWECAQQVFSDIVAFINKNVDVFHGLSVVVHGTDTSIPTFPPSIAANVISLTIAHERVSKSRKTPLQMTVRHVTVLAQIIKDASHLKCVVATDVPLPTYTSVVLTHYRYHDRILNAQSDEERRFWIRKEMACVMPFVQKVTSFLERLE